MRTPIRARYDHIPGEGPGGVSFCNWVRLWNRFSKKAPRALRIKPLNTLDLQFSNLSDLVPLVQASPEVHLSRSSFARHAS